MTLFLASAAAFGLAFLALSLGALLGRGPLRGRCAGCPEQGAGCRGGSRCRGAGASGGEPS